MHVIRLKYATVYSLFINQLLVQFCFVLLRARHLENEVQKLHFFLKFQTKFSQLSFFFARHLETSKVKFQTSLFTPPPSAK